MADIGGLQLLPSQKKNFSFSSLSGRSVLFVVSIILFLIVAVVYFFIRYYIGSTTSSIQKTEDELSAIYQARDKAKEVKLFNLSKQLATTGTLLRSHVYWSAGFQAISKLIERDVTLTTLDVDSAKKTYSFHALARNYATVARQIASFYSNSAITNVALGKVGIAGNGNVDFVMTLTFKPDIFLFQQTNQ